MILGTMLFYLNYDIRNDLNGLLGHKITFALDLILSSALAVSFYKLTRSVKQVSQKRYNETIMFLRFFFYFDFIPLILLGLWNAYCIVQYYKNWVKSEAANLTILTTY